MFLSAQLLQMEPVYRKAAKQRELRVLNQKEDREFRHKLDMLDKQFRYTQKTLKQRRDSLIKEHRKMMMVKVCEPKATVNVAMKEIDEHASAVTHFRAIHTSDGGGQLEQRRSTSAPQLPVKATNSARHRRNIQSNLSLMQMKNIAAIDSISEKELARREREAREEMERMRQLQRETLHKRVAAFIEGLKDKGNMRTCVEPR